MEKTKELLIYPNAAGAIGKIFLDDKEINMVSPFEKHNIKKDGLETILILDVSGSMGLQVSRLCEKIIPKFLENLSYKENEKIYFIMFESSTTVQYDTIENIFSKKYKSLGSTYFLPALEKLDKILEECSKKNLRILTISDGQIADQEKSVQLASLLAEKYKGKFNVNSQAVRYFTTSSEPDTRGLSSVLQFSTQFSNLVDISMKLKDNEILDAFNKLFENDSFSYSVNLVSDFKIFKQTPFSKPNNYINLEKGENIFWLTNPIYNMPENELEEKKLVEEMKIYFIQNNDNQIKTFVNISFRNINLDNYWQILENKFIYFLQRLKILKIINSKESIDEMTNTIKYFETLENDLERHELACADKGEEILELCISLAQRAENIKKIINKREKNISVVLSQIANDDKVNILNSAQQAEYLRNLQVDKNSKGLAKRAINSGLDFDGITRAEVINMHKNLKEISDIDDTDHTISFYSNCTTLEGIKMCCKLVEDGYIDQINCMDILKLINIVGVACDSPIGNYPDPMIWRVNKIFAGCYTSMSDILTVSEISSAKKNLKDISTKEDIHNVIPFFEDERILKFLKKYAPNILEYSASFGMRRIIANVPQTFNYIIVAGSWKLLQIINKNKSDVNLKIFIHLIKTYEISVGNYFNYIMELINEKEANFDDQKEKKETKFKSESFKSFYLGNNGIYNMFSVLMKLIKSKRTNYLDYILRAIYAHESYLIVKKKNKNLEFSEGSEGNILYKLLGIDLKKYGTKLPEMFYEYEEKKTFFDKYFINFEMLNDFIKSCSYLDYICLLPDYLEAIYSENPLESLRKIPEMSRNLILQKLNIDRNKKFINLFSDSDQETYKNEISVEPLNFTSSDEDNNKNILQDTNHSNSKIDILSKFKFYCYVQALLYPNQSKRCDEKSNKSNINDLIYMRKFEREIRVYILNVYREFYHSEIFKQNKNEKEILVKILIDELMHTDLENFKNLIKNGIKKAHKTLAITDSSKDGYMDLIYALANSNEKCSYRFQKIEILAFGFDPEDKSENPETIFNNKVIMRRDLFKLFQPIYDKFEQDFFSIWIKINGNKHIYRDKPNRQGHCNEKPSYWALGYETLLMMKGVVTKETWIEYKIIHKDCCGLRFIKE